MFFSIVFGCIPISYMVPPTPQGYEGQQVGMAAFVPSVNTTAFGEQFWYQKVSEKHSYGFRIDQLNTAMVIMIGGGVYYRRNLIDQSKLSLGWEAEIGGFYARAGLPITYRNSNWDLYSSPSIRVQMDTQYVLWLPTGIAYYPNSKWSILCEYDSRFYLNDLFIGGQYFRGNPSFGMAYHW